MKYCTIRYADGTYPKQPKHKGDGLSDRTYDITKSYKYVSIPMLKKANYHDISDLKDACIVDTETGEVIEKLEWGELTKMLTLKEQQVKEYLQNKVVPALEKFLEEKNPELFSKWGKNCCIQTSYVCYNILRLHLRDYKWEIYENHYIYEKTGKMYNHSFVIGKNKNGENLLVDLSRHPIWNDLFVKVSSYKNPYFGTEIKDKLIKENKLNVLEMDNIDEYYTQMKGKDFYNEVIKRINDFNRI
jgi:hypothetical protein